MRRCKPRNAEEARRWVEARNNGRIAAALEAGERHRQSRVLLSLNVLRNGIDTRPVLVQIIDDGGRRRREVEEDGEAWPGHYSRKSLVKWFDQVLKSAGV